MKSLIAIAIAGLAVAGTAAAQDNAASSSTEATANYIENAPWTLPSLADIYDNASDPTANVIVDCAVLPTGHVSDCSVVSQGDPAKVETRKAIGVAYLRRAFVDPKSIPGGILPGDRVQFHYNWPDLMVSDLAEAAVLPVMDKDIQARYAHSAWRYPSAGDMLSVYPDHAAEEEISDIVDFSCRIVRNGSMAACQVLYDPRPQYGFGPVTILMFQKLTHVDPKTVAGGVQDGDYKLFTYFWRPRRN